MFGIPSVSSVNLQYKFTVSNFASHIIPNVGNVHSYVDGITNKNSYGFGQQNKTGISTNNNYSITFNSTDSSITDGRYDETTTSDVTVKVYYLDNDGNSPTIATHTNDDKDVPDIGHIFKDSETSYTAFDLYTFNGSDAIGSSAIDTDDSNFATTYSSEILSMLLRFDGKFVSGGYSRRYSSTSISPFSDWSSGYVDGPDYTSYSNTGINGFKWIAIDVTGKRSGSNDLGNFKINDSSPDTAKFGDTTDGYEAYIYHGGKFGALKGANSSGDTSWFNNFYTIQKFLMQNSSANGALQNDSTSGTVGVDAFIDGNDSSNIYLVVGLPETANSYFSFS